MAGATRVTLTLKSKLLKEVSVDFYVPSSIVDPDDSIIVGLVAVVEKLISAYVIKITITLAAVHTGAVAAGPYNAAQDRLFLSIDDDAGRPHNYRLTAPTASCFEADTVTPKVGSSPLKDLIDEINASALAEDGSTGMTDLGEGFRTEFRRRLKR